MSYGGRFRGNSGQVVIDEARSALFEIHNGTYQRAGSGGVSVSYPTPITSQAPPVVFVNPNGAGHFHSFNHSGRPGNWTGWSAVIVTNMPGTVGASGTGRYSACTTEPKPSADKWGMRIKNAGAEVVYDSGYRVARFIAGSQAWSGGGSTAWGGAGGIVFQYRLPWALPATTYLMISGVRNAWDNVNFSDQPYIGFTNSNKQQVNFNIHSFDNYPPVNVNWPMVAANFELPN